MSKDLFGDVIVEQDDNNPYTQKVGVPVYEPEANSQVFMN